MSNRKKVMSAEAMLDRRHLLACNLDKVVDAMKGSGLADPVGFVVDSTDLQGRQFAIHMRRAAGAPADEATRQTDQANTEYLRNRMTPTLITVTRMEDAKVILPCTSPTALTSLKAWEGQRQPGHCLVVVIASGGNTYASVGLSLARDGINRASTKGL